MGMETKVQRQNSIKSMCLAVRQSCRLESRTCIYVYHIVFVYLNSVCIAIDEGSCPYYQSMHMLLPVPALSAKVASLLAMPVLL